ncbi:glycoside hydrolase [Blastopirellula sp. J2-11]|uniref:sialidase family protein n=1 Tax=Blastopirellula sp. J2-11 TaxID=2943192 RepID=UPI0021C87384|nr:sialidase family protein [Blastopirellula sp. J2-11]UUO04928.1 glycoside hydrolase [Blastopirellula sp. J2-11]
MLSRLGVLFPTTLLLVGLSFVQVPSLQADEPQAELAKGVELTQLKKIWSQGRHNAFTDLVRFHDKWFCAFREGEKHVSADGSLRILVSSDGEKWESAALVSMPGLDLRDAKICVTPDDQLMLCGAAVTQPPHEKSHQTYVWFSKDGASWTQPHAIGDKNYWIWRIVWSDGAAYAVGYQTGVGSRAERTKRGNIRLYKSEDGETFETLVKDLGVRSAPNESSLLFLEDGTALCVVRRDGEPDATAVLGASKAPYTHWDWKSLGVRVGGPQILQLPDGQLVVSGRRYLGKAKTALWRLDPAKSSLQELAVLPSGGDTSYPGLVFHDGQLWVSYYSSHEGKTSIYLAQLILSPSN